MRIAVIDSGLDPMYKANGMVEYYDYSEGSCVYGTAVDENGHGTACFDIIYQQCPNAEYIVIKVFGKELRATIDVVHSAFSKCLELDVDIINASLGVASAFGRDELKETCEKIINKGTYIISSCCDQEDIPSWPANFDFSIKVAGDDRHKIGQFTLYKQSPLFVRTYNGKRRVKWLNGTSAIAWGNSFACATISGLIAAKMSIYPQRISANDILEDLASRIEYCVKNETKSTVMLNNQNVVIFPYNKEMHSLIRYKDVLPFTILGVGDFAFSKHIGKDAGECISVKPTNLKITSKFQELLSLQARAIILGDLSELSNIYSKDYLSYYATQAFQSNLDVYSIELLKNEQLLCLKALAAQYDKRFFALNDFINISEYKKRSVIPCQSPVVAVMGTGPKVGKFTLQAAIIETLKQIGYKVGTLCTEPQGYLFGYNTVPLGNYHLLDLIPLHEQIRYIQTELTKISVEQDAEILITGGQSGVVPFNNTIPTGYNTLSSIITMLSTRPDAIILCINPNDDIDYVIRTINAINSFGYGRVLACVMSAQEKDVILRHGLQYESIHILSQSLLVSRCMEYEQRLGLPCINSLDSDHIVKIIKMIQKHFSR